MDNPTVTATPEDTLEDFVRLSGRGYSKVRHRIGQRRSDSGSSVPSVLGGMLTDRKRRSLQLYLLLITVWPWLKKQDNPLPAQVWARALTTATGRKWTPTNVSEAWADLRSRKLVETERRSRGLMVTPRREDGAAAYTEPGTRKGDHDESYFTLPKKFWIDGWFEKLSMPGLTMLIIIASRTSSAAREETWLTNVDAGKWYGLSPRSVEAGITELKTEGLLEERVEWVKAPLSAIGATKRHWYSLTGEFSTTSRLTMQDDARQDRDKRIGTTKKKTRKPKKRSAEKRTKATSAEDGKTAKKRKKLRTTKGKH